MKLCRIALKNLNSLYGEHEIDLQRDLADTPLFVIVGPTGAGKSTVMDAVSLALFGETPRLRNLRMKGGGADDFDSRHVMSRGTGECWAKLEFTKLAPNGQRERYRATWYCHRANKQATGAFQTPRRALERLADEGTWEVLTDDHRKKNYAQFFAQVLEDMTVADFQRSILLAQGEFTALLRSGADEKATILERLTSTEVYARIGRRANARRIETGRALEHIESRLEAMALLSPDEVSALRQRHRELEERSSAARADLEAAERRQRWVAERETMAAARQLAETEAAEARTEAAEVAPTLARLAEDERCRPAARALESQRHAEAELTTARSTADALSDVRQRLAARVAEARGDLEGTRRRAALAAERLELESRAIVESQHLHDIANRAELAAEAADARVRGLRAERDTAEQAHGANEAALEEAHERVTSLQLDLAELPMAQDVVANLSGLQTRLVGLEDARRNLSAAKSRAAALSARREALTRELTGLRTASAESSDRIGELGPSLEAARRALGITEEASLTTRRQSLNAAIEEAGRSVERHRHASRLQARRDERNQLEVRLGEHERDIGNASEALQRCCVTLGSAQRHLEDVALAVSLLEQRANLTEGAPCPLCGSEEHPYAAHGPEGEDALRRRHAELSEKVRAVSDERARLEDALRAFERSRATDRARHDALSEELADLDAGQARGSLQEAEAGLSRLQDERRRFSALEATLSQLNASLAEAVRQRDVSEQGQAQLVAALHSNAEDLEAASAAIAEAEQLTTTRRQGLDDELARLKLVAPGQTHEMALDAARQRARTYESIVEHLAEASAVAADRQSARRESLTTLVESRGRSEASEGEAERLAMEAAEARAVADKTLGGRPPAQVLETLERALADEEEMAEHKAGVLERLETEHAETSGRLAELQQRCDTLAAAVDSATTEAQSLLRALGLQDAESLQARLLDEAQRLEIEALGVRTRQAVDAAEARLALLQAQLSAHLAETSSDRPEQEAEEAQLAAAVEGARQAYEEVNQLLGGVRSELQRHQGVAADVRELRQAWRSAKDEADLWLRLHRLIGEAEGKSFQRFAQTLSLSELVERANTQLAALSSRYRLDVARDRDGRARLDFAVIDRFQANRRRPITTLSGGETFLVSLALALGLADMRRGGMPIETLLLDEGFGTLDPRSLDIAIDALERLHASNRIQVGIISHVEALRERIEARIVVQPMGNGRSRVLTEVGRLASRSDPAAAPDDGEALSAAWRA